MSAAISESELLEGIVPDLEAEGFEVYIHPSKAVVPPFLGNFRPDAIARGTGKSLVIEVIRPSEHASKKVERLAQLLKGHPGWELRILWASPTAAPARLRVQSVNTIERTLGEVDQLASEQRLEPALLLGWAAFEALGRVLLPEQLGRPQTPGRLVEILAQDGHLTPTEADELRRLAKKRNELIHGELATHVRKFEIDQFVQILRRTINNLIVSGGEQL
jgi:uncharacterized protein YutE (UPF0331/DUF86 family)